MEFKFESNQEFQVKAIEAVAALLDGQPRIEVEMTFALGAGYAAVSNRLDLDEETLLKNLRSVQASNGISPDAELKCIELTYKDLKDLPFGIAGRFANFSVEMETGTGKTYVYLRTALELYRRYGLRKFIVVVHSVAVREGVLKTLEITEKHFRELYDNVPYRYYVYDSASLTQIRQFALSDGVEIMVMTIDSFNKASNVIHQSTDRLQGEIPINLVQATRPVLILDEPQNMESELRIKALVTLNPLFALRYSATHRNPYNLVYRLTPFAAYRQALVKRVEVAGIEEEDNANRVFLRLDDIRTNRNTITARLALHRLMAGGTIKEQIVTVKPGDNLESKANRREYAPYVVDEINAAEGWIRFSNDVELQLGEAQGPDKEAIFEAQIRYTIVEHFRKQTRLKPAGIKVLSLFFIDKVANYAEEDGIIRQLFIKVFNELKTRYPEWQDVNPIDVQKAYFASRKTRSGETIYEDSKTGETEKDKEAYDLIMCDKARLLSLNEPTCFIFSHSALREGWDNPNIFQICTLNQTTSEIKKRQEIGRGVRLAVNQAGDRVHDEKVNILTVVTNESYQDYVANYQSELEEAFGTGNSSAKPANARKRGVARLRKEYILRPEFKTLWERIKHKTRYAVRINNEKLIINVVAELDEAEIRPPHLVVAKAMLEADQESFKAVQTAERQIPIAKQKAVRPNLLQIMADLMERTTPPVLLTRRTLLEIFKRTTNKKAAMENPFEFATVAVRFIKKHLTDQLMDGIQYTRINEWYEMTQFEPEISSWEEYLIPASYSVYDHVVIDDTNVERQFVKALEKREDVKLYIKLPSWFTVDTPVGSYNPDWAIVIEPRDEHGDPTEEELLYLVRETKSGEEDLRPDETRKIRCGQRHFEEALGVSYKVVTNTAEILP